MSLGQAGLYRSDGERYTIFFEMPPLEIGTNRKSNVHEYGMSPVHGAVLRLTVLPLDVLLSSTLESLVSTSFPNHLVVYSGSPHSTTSHPKRQLVNPSALSFIVSSRAGTGSGILHRYQLLTPGLIMTFIVTVGLLLPIVAFGIRALASVQSPIAKGEAPKGFNAGERKKQ